MTLSPVEHLIGYMHIVERDRSSRQLVNEFMTAAGFSEDEIGTARSDARRAGFTRDSGIGERLSSAGRAEAAKFVAQLERQI